MVKGICEHKLGQQKDLGKFHGYTLWWTKFQIRSNVY